MTTVIQRRLFVYSVLLLVLAIAWRPASVPAQTNLVHVATNAALKAVTAGSVSAIRRDGFAMAGDGGAALYYWSAFACPLNGGNGDDGSQVKPTTGTGCWLADMASAMDVRVWGAVCDGTTDDSTALNNALAVAAIVTIPPLSCAGKNIAWGSTGSSKVVGTPNKSVIKLHSSGVTNDYLAWYRGAGPVTVSGVTFQCPIYSFSAPAVPAGKWAFSIQPPSSGVSQISQATLRDVAAIGCDQQFIVLSVNYIDIDHIFLDRPYTFGLNLGDSSNYQGTPPYNSSHIRINNLWGRGAGSYCGGFLGTQSSATGPTPGTVDFEAHNLNCNGAGLFVNTKLCFDLHGDSYDKIVFEGSGINCWNGGIEAKTTNQNTNMRPNFAGNVNLRFTYFSNFDQGTGVLLPLEVVNANPPTPHKLMKVENHTTFSPPEGYTNNFPYLVGSVITANGNTYYALNDGMSATSGGGPSCSGSSPTTCQDGAVWWLYVQATPSGSAQKLVAMEIEALQDVTAHVYAQQTAYGVLLLPRGNQDMSGVQIYFDGTTTKNCLTDYYTSTSWAPVGTINKLTLKGWNCRTTGGWSAIQIGRNDGTYVTNYTDLTIDGGLFWTDGDDWAVRTNNSVASTTTPSISGTVIGAPQFKGGRGAFYINDMVDLSFAPGVTMETKCPSGGSCSYGSAIYASANSSGTLAFHGPTSVKSSLAPTAAYFPTVNKITGSSLDVVGQFYRGFAAAVPTTQAGSAGDKVLIKTPTTAVPNGWSCTTAGNPCTWTAY